MTLRGKAYVAGVFEHPLRDIPDRSTAQVHAEVAVGALADAGLSMSDVDGYLCSGDAPGFGPLSMADFLGLRGLPTSTPWRSAARPTSCRSVTRPPPLPPASARSR